MAPVRPKDRQTNRQTDSTLSLAAAHKHSKHIVCMKGIRSVGGGGFKIVVVACPCQRASQAARLGVGVGVRDSAIAGYGAYV